MEPNSSHSYRPADPSASGRTSAVESGAALPQGYGDNRLCILPKDPFWFFAYWEITEERAERLRVEQGKDVWERCLFVLRVYDVSEATDGMTEGPYFDHEVHKFARESYVQVPRSGRTYQAELGLRESDGRFIGLLKSNRLRLPLGRVSDQTDSQWMAVGYGKEDENWNKFLEHAGEKGRGSADVARTMAQRWKFLRSVYSGSAGSSSSSRPSAAAKPAAPVPLPKEKR